MKNYKFIVCLALIGLAGCSDGDDENPAKETSNKSFLSTQLEAIEKAKGVEQTVQDGFNRMDQAMDAQGQ
jgi:uncharacterized lipoprotein